MSLSPEQISQMLAQCKTQCQQWPDLLQRIEALEDDLNVHLKNNKRDDVILYITRNLSARLEALQARINTACTTQYAPPSPREEEDGRLQTRMR